jgi:hypothetical protein
LKAVCKSLVVSSQVPDLVQGVFIQPPVLRVGLERDFRALNSIKLLIFEFPRNAELET